MEHIVAKLEELAELKAAADVTRLDYEAKRAEILRAVQAELDALEDEYRPLFEAVDQRVESLEAEIRSDVLECGATVKGRRFQAVFVRGRVTWDTPGLDQYAREHPDIERYRRQGEPSVALRVAK